MGRLLRFEQRAYGEDLSDVLYAENSLAGMAVIVPNREETAHLVFLEHNDVVNKVFHVVHLVGRDDHGAFFVHVGRDGPPKLGFRRDVEPIGRFVHEEKARACGEGETDIRLF